MILEQDRNLLCFFMLKRELNNSRTRKDPIPSVLLGREVAELVNARDCGVPCGRPATERS